MHNITLPVALSKILSHSETTKNANKLLAFGKNNSRPLSNFSQIHLFWKFDHISRTYKQTNYRNIWFAKLTIILIMTEQVFFPDISLEKALHLNAVECNKRVCKAQKTCKAIKKTLTTSQMKHTTTSQWNVAKASQWYVSTTSYWYVTKTSQW